MTETKIIEPFRFFRVFRGRKRFICPPNTLKDAKISKTKIGWFVFPRQENQFSFFFWCHFVCFVGRNSRSGRVKDLFATKHSKRRQNFKDEDRLVHVPSAMIA